MTAFPESLNGLSSSEVADRVRRGLTNRYPSRTSRAYAQILADNLFNLFNITLAILLALLFALGRAGDTLFAGGRVVTAFAVWRSTFEQTKLLAPLRVLMAK